MVPVKVSDGSWQKKLQEGGESAQVSQNVRGSFRQSTYWVHARRRGTLTAWCEFDQSRRIYRRPRKVIRAEPSEHENFSPTHRLL